MAALLGNVSWRNGGKTSETGMSRLLSKIHNFNGVVGQGDLKVTAQGSPDKTVAVAIGDCIIGALSPSASTYSYHGFFPTTGNLTVTNNTSGSARVDTIVSYVDSSVVSSASNDNPNALKIDIVAGTPSGSPVHPSNSDIATAIGASNPFIRLADIAVANNFTSITTGNITDVRTQLAIATQSSTVASAAATSATWVSQSVNQSFTCVGNNPIIILMQIIVRTDTAGSAFAQARVKRGSNVIFTSAIAGSQGTNDRVQICGFALETPPPGPGTYTYDIELSNPNSVGNMTPEGTPQLLIFELKP